MKTKLTLNTDHEVVEKAKKFAFSRKISSSSTVENCLSALSGKKSRGKKKFSGKTTITPAYKKAYQTGEDI